MKVKERRGIFGTKAWIEDKSGNSVTDKFDLRWVNEKGPFIVVEKACKSTGIYLSFIRESLNDSYERVYSTFPKKVSENLWKIGNGQCGFDLYNNQGELLFSNLTFVGTASASRVLIRNDKLLWGYIDEYGRIIRKCQYDKASEYYGNGYALVGNKNGDTYFWHSLDIIGRNCPPYVNADNVLFEDPDSNCFIIKRKSRLGLCNRIGEIIINCVYDEIEKKDKFYILRQKDRYGLVYEDGRVLFDCIYLEIIETHDKFIALGTVNKEVMKLEYVK